MLEAHRHLLIANRPAIVEDLLVEDVLSELRSKFILDRDDSELILNETTSRKKAGRLLDILPDKGYSAFQFFYESLTDKYSHLALLLVEGTGEEQALRNDGSPLVTTGQQGPMTGVHRDLLTANRVDIVEDLLVDDVINTLLAKFVFDYEDVELIRAEKTSKRQAEKLLDLLVTKGDDAFGYFLAALKDTYPHIAELLETDNNNQRSRVQSILGDSQVVESKLLEGGVPQRPLVFTNRPREIHFLRTALRSLTERDAWVVLHGMAGCGKTILAAEALRSASLLEKSFPGGVFWLQVGPVDRPKLLMKMQNLCSRLDEDKVRPLPRNLEEARDRLKFIFAHQHPRTLLVLDDLWSAHDARYFSIRARVLVTTRDVSIAKCIDGTKCPVHVPEKLSVAQCLDILSQWTKKQVTELPNEAEHIIEECTGHPLAVSMIGAMLWDHPARWLYYWTQLSSHKLGKFKSNFAYQYPSLSEAIAMSIDNLSDDLRDKYHDFVLFDASIKVPISVFCLLWDMEKEEVEDLMEDFVNKSLVKSVQASHGAHEHSLGYAIHNLQLNYMLEKCEDIETRHKRLVQCYKKTCKGLFSSLADDGYIYWNLIHHMLEAKLESKAIDLLTNLAWVTRKLEVTGPADIINDYIKVNKLIEEEEKDEFKNLHDFYHFVRTNAHLFVSRPIPDVVQAALSEPANNDVYKQAKQDAVKRSKKGKLFVDWCNKHKETTYSLEMTLKPHDGAIHCCSFSSDGKSVISSSSDGTAKVWEAVSGKVLHSLEGHDDVVNCCAFNHDNSKVLTTSFDKTVKIWKIGHHHDHELKLTYSDHKQDVYCAAFSPTATRKDVISCSADNTIRIWDCETGSTRVACKGHSDVVRWCCFSSDGERLASGSHDQTVKIWRTDTGDCLGTTPKHDAFVSYCCFNQDGTHVYASSATCISIWDSATCETLGSLDIGSLVLAFVLSPVDEDKIAVALSDATLQLWDITNNKQLNVYHGHKSWVYTVDFSPDATQLVSGSADETAKVWPVDTTAYAKRIKLKRVFDAFFAPDKVTIAVADSQNKLKIFEGLHGKEICESEIQPRKLTCCVFSRNGINVAIGLESGEIKVLAVETCQPVVKFDGHESIVFSLAFNQSGSVLLSCSQDKSYMTWDAETGKALLPKESRHEDAVTLGFFFNNDQRIATSSKDGTTNVWDSASGQRMFTCDHHSNEWVVVSAVSPDGEKLITGSVDGEVKAWHAVSGEQIFNISPHSDCIRSLSINENNQVFATGSDDGTVMISSLLDGKPVASCTSHSGSWVTDMAFAKNSSQLVTIGNNIQWHELDGTLLQQFSIKGSYLRHIKWSQDFTTFITVDNIGVLYILKVIS